MFAENEVEDVADCVSEKQMRYCTEEGEWTIWDGSYEYASCSVPSDEESDDFMDFFIIVQAALMY